MQTQNDRRKSSHDTELEARITASLIGHHVPSLRNVSVEVLGDTVVLRGEVSSFYAKQLSHHSARRLAGDTPVIDEVRVLTPAAFRDPRRPRFAAVVGAVLLLAALAGGCSRQAPTLEVHPVTGQVTYNGKPAAGAHVTFHPKVREVAHPIPSAKVDPQGNFSLTTYRSEDGAPFGEYSVTVELRPVITKDGEIELGPNILPPQYSSPKTTKVVARVAEGANSVPIKIVR